MLGTYTDIKTIKTMNGFEPKGGARVTGENCIRIL